MTIAPSKPCIKLNIPCSIEIELCECTPHIAITKEPAIPIRKQKALNPKGALIVLYSNK